MSKYRIFIFDFDGIILNSLYLNKFLTRNELDKINDEFKNMKIKKINSFGYLHKL